MPKSTWKPYNEFSPSQSTNWSADQFQIYFACNSHIWVSPGLQTNWYIYELDVLSALHFIFCPLGLMQKSRFLDVMSVHSLFLKYALGACRSCKPGKSFLSWLTKLITSQRQWTEKKVWWPYGGAIRCWICHKISVFDRLLAVRNDGKLFTSVYRPICPETTSDWLASTWHSLQLP